VADVAAKACPGSSSVAVTANNAAIAKEAPVYESPSIHTNSHTVTGLADDEEEA
jgi:hypothetical protein